MLLTPKQIIQLLIITLLCVVRTLRKVSDRVGGVRKVGGQVSKTIPKFHKAINVYMYSDPVCNGSSAYSSILNCMCVRKFTYAPAVIGINEEYQGGKLKDPARSIDD